MIEFIRHNVWLQYVLTTAACIGVVLVLFGIIAAWEWAFGIGGKWSYGSDPNEDFHYN